jgi:hypothetical protein
MNRRKNYPFVSFPQRFLLLLFLGSSTVSFAQLPVSSGAPNQALLNEAVDISEDFRNFSNT